MAEQLSQRDRLLGLIQKKYPGYHPILAMADMAHMTPDEGLKFDCHRTIAKYIEPELRSVEVRGEGVGSTINIITSGANGPRDLIEDMSARRQALLRVIDSKPEVGASKEVEPCPVSREVDEERRAG